MVWHSDLKQRENVLLTIKIAKEHKISLLESKCEIITSGYDEIIQQQQLYMQAISTRLAGTHDPLSRHP